MGMPKIGDTLWIVREHYYIGGKYSPRLEYSVYQGTVKAVSEYGEIVVKYRREEDYADLTYLREKRDKWFDNPRDAAMEAKRMTDDYMRRWGWMWRDKPDMPPMRRTWEKYLTEE